MLLEDVGVRKTEFQKLQDVAVADAKTIDESIIHMCNVLSAHGLGVPYSVKSILNRLRECYKLDLHGSNTKRGIDNPFLRQLRQVAMIDVLRDIKHSARIPVPDSYLLVGIADEGPSYKGVPGYEDVFCLSAGQIYGVCTPTRVQNTSLIVCTNIEPACRSLGIQNRRGSRAMSVYLEAQSSILAMVSSGFSVCDDILIFLTSATCACNWKAPRGSNLSIQTSQKCRSHAICR
jgi:hypothetical protein